MLIGLLGRVVLLIPLMAVIPSYGASVTGWDFNQYDGDVRRINASDGQGSLVIEEDWNAMSLSNPAGSKLNAVESRDAGKALSLSGMARNGKSFELFVPLESCPGAQVSAAVRRSGTGFGTLRLTWSQDGGKTFQDGPTWSIGETWAIHSADLAMKGTPSQLIIRFELDGASSSRGTLLVDNLQIRCLRPQSERPEN